MKLGIDVGRTHTDAVLLNEEGSLIRAAKRLTSEDILSGIYHCVKEILADTNVPTSELKGVFIGTTHVFHALNSNQGLAKTALVRIVKQETLMKSAIGWPKSLKNNIKSVHYVTGRNTYKKANEHLEFRGEWLKALKSEILQNEIDSVCVVGAFSPLYEREELAVKQAIASDFPDLPITTSHQLGTIGFIERENTALLNAILAKVIRNTLSGLSHLFSNLSIECPYWLIQNGGSVMDVQQAIEHPILTIGSGVANSIRGASVLCGFKDCIVVDVGGRTIDIGRIRNGRLEEAMLHSKLLGIRIHVPMPKSISIPLNGGTQEVTSDIKDAIERLQVQEKSLPIVFVGGGSPRFSETLFGKYERFINPAGYSYCNAIGACYASLNSQVDKVYWLHEKSKEEIITKIKDDLFQQLLAKGANKESVAVVSIEEYPFDYLKGEVLRIRAKATSKLNV